jgi:membrane protein DedA with SNARE-associated domain
MAFVPFQVSNVSSALLWSAVLIATGALGTAALGPLGSAYHALFG